MNIWRIIRHIAKASLPCDHKSILFCIYDMGINELDEDMVLDHMHVVASSCVVPNQEVHEQLKGIQ